MKLRLVGARIAHRLSQWAASAARALGAEPDAPNYPRPYIRVFTSESNCANPGMVTLHFGEHTTEGGRW